MNVRRMVYFSLCLGFCLCILAASCRSLTPDTSRPTVPPTSNSDAVPAAQKNVDALAGAQPSGIPDHFVPEEPAEIQRTGDDFDVNAYFAVLDGLSVEPGYVIDYLYVWDGMGGYPFLYARSSDRPPYASYDEFVAAFGNGQGAAGDVDYYGEYLDHIEVDDTREGYFQFAALNIMANQFYLNWHAGYNDATIVCDAEGLERTLSIADSYFGGDLIPESLRRKAAKLDLEPTVEFPDGSTALVRLVTFSKWGGFEEVTYTIDRRFPHTIVDTKTQTLIEFDCGVSF